MVNTIDESLRVLKNELRKRTPLSAGLLGPPSEILSAMMERGVQPDLVADTTAGEAQGVGDFEPASAFTSPALERMIERGAERMFAQAVEQGKPAVQEVSWTAANPADLARLDKIALDLLPTGDSIRRRWLEQAPGSFYRQRPLERVLDLDRAERENLLEAFKFAAAGSAFQPPASVRWEDPASALQSVTL